MVKVLLLEDDPNYRGVIERILVRFYPCAVKSVATEGQAWEELSVGEFDLVLLDLYIDRLRCWETLKRAVNHRSRPRAIVFSCEDTLANAEYAITHGAFSFLSKPFNFARLRSTIDSALDANRRNVNGGSFA